MRSIGNRNRRGVVLVLVVGILAILMLMASTLVLLARVELRASKAYQKNRLLETIIGATRFFCIEVLQEDKFGADGAPYNYEKLAGEAAKLAAALSSGEYPDRADGDNLAGDDEGFDHAKVEEWMPGTELWRLFSGPGNDAELFDTNGDGIVDVLDDKSALWLDVQSLLGQDYGARVGQGVKAEVALYFMDVGGARSDINSHGNLQGPVMFGNRTHAQSQGLSPFEISLADAIYAAVDDDNILSLVDAAATARALIKGRPLIEGRYGDDDLPGIAGADKDMLNNPYNPLGNAYFDFDATGTAENTTGNPSYVLADESAEFNPEFPISDVPFGPFDLYDFVLGTNTGSRGANLLLKAVGLYAADLRNFTTRSGGTILAARSIRSSSGDPSNAWSATNTTASGSLSGYEFLNPSGFPLPASRTTKEEVTLQRAIQDGLSGATDTELYEFIWALEPFVKDSSGADIAPADAQNIIHQVAVNLRDFIDVDSDGTPWDPGTKHVYGVELAPYIAEVEAAIDTSNDGLYDFSFAPTLDGVLPTPGERLRSGPTLYYDADSSGDYSAGEDVWIDNADGTMGNYDAGDTLITGTLSGGETGTAMAEQDNNNPPTGWGKYIKLVNPWNKDIDLAGYKLVLRAQYPGGTFRLRKWAFDLTDGIWRSEPHTSNIVIPLVGTIPARGHFLIVDNAQVSGPFGATLAGLPAANYMEYATINYMQEAGGGLTDADDPTSDEFEGGTFGPSVIELRRTIDGELMMRFQVQETGTLPLLTEDEDDDDDFVTKFVTGLNLFNHSTQIGDPRPCWWRETAVGAGGASVGGAPWFGDPWAMGGTNVQPRSFATWTGTTSSTQFGWFNLNWRSQSVVNPYAPGNATDPVSTGDKWYKLYPDAESKPGNKNNLLHSFAPVDPCAVGDTDIYSGVTDEKIMDIGRMANPGYLGFVHAGVEWGTLSLGEPGSPGGFGEAELVYLRNFGDYLTGPFSPYEDDLDNDWDSSSDGSDTGIQSGDRSGPEVRRLGKVNVNTASEAVLRAVLSPDVLSDLMGWNEENGEDPYDQAELLAEEIITERGNAPFSSVDDLLERRPNLFQLPPPGGPNTFQREALARFIYNNVTVRSDVWAVVGRARLYSDANDNGVADPGELLADRRFYFVLDRSHDPIRVIAWRLLP